MHIPFCISPTNIFLSGIDYSRNGIACIEQLCPKHYQNDRMFPLAGGRIFQILLIYFVPEMTMPDGKVMIIPLTGTVEGKLFHGRIMPGAADVQVTNPAGVRRMRAQYMLEGLDNTGAACHIFVENHGYFQRDHRPKPFEAWPPFRTDSQALRPYLQGMHFRAEGYSNKIGVISGFLIRMNKR